MEEVEDPCLSDQDFTKQLEKCVCILKKAGTDNEKLAALMMVTKLIKADKCNLQAQKILFDAIGFKFLVRLLRTAKVPEGCNNYIYKSLSLTILSSFSGLQEVKEDPRMLTSVPLILDVLVSCLNIEQTQDDNELTEGEFKSMIDSCYDCLTAVCMTDKGRTVLIDSRSVSQLCTCYIHATYGNHRALVIIQQIISTNGAEVWTKNMKGLQELLGYLGENFSRSKEVDKFQFCDILASVFTSVSKDQIPAGNFSWQKNIPQGFMDLIKSRLEQKQRESVLMLISVIVESLGPEFLLPPNLPDAKPFLLAINLNSVEVGMIIPFSPLGQVREKSNQLSAYFSLIENTIKFLVSGEEGPPFDPSQIIQLYSILTETLKCVILFLQEITKSLQSFQATDPLLQACIRLVGVWMKEDSEALCDEIHDLVPMLLTFSKNLLCTDEVENPVVSCSGVLSPLFEGFCQLASDTKGREQLLQHEAYVPVGQYLLHALSQFPETDANILLCVETLCDLLLQLTETDTCFIDSDSIYVSLFNRISEVLHQIVFKSECLNVVAVMSLLGLTLFNSHHITREVEEVKQKTLLKSTITFLSRAHLLDSQRNRKEKVLVINEEYQVHWDSVSGYWLSTMKVLTKCIQNHPQLTTTVLLQTGWIPRLLKLLVDVQKISVHVDYSSAYLNLLYALIITKEARTVIIDNCGAEVAKKFNHSELCDVLSVT
ncbi:neurochondrin [Octopus bimaculoides]|nr:neurochondrin [Octopus bimaculoides]|eukprot:XP_014769219.1 PREDICTED: neurochondrin-like [Octopus bimaculoides]